MQSFTTAILFIALSVLVSCILYLWNMFHESDEELDELEDLIDDWWSVLEWKDKQDDEIDDEKESNGSEG